MNFSNSNLFLRPVDSIDGSTPGAPGRLRNLNLGDVQDKLSNRNRRVAPGLRQTFGGMFAAPETAYPSVIPGSNKASQDSYVRGPDGANMNTRLPGADQPLPQWTMQPRPPEFPNVDPQAATTATPGQILAARQNVPGITPPLGAEPQFKTPDIGAVDVGSPVTAPSAPEPTGGASMGALVYPGESPTGQPVAPIDRNFPPRRPGSGGPPTTTYGGMFARPKDTQENALTYGL